MKIGEFAKKHGITIDTIRHYMDLELLLPDKKGGHYFFGKKEVEDLTKILELKKLKFTLAEIQKIVTYTRLSQLRTKEDKEYIRRIFSAKRNMLEEEKVEIKIALDILKNRIDEIDTVDNKSEKDGIQVAKMGIPLTFLQYFCCPICNNHLELENGKVTGNMVMDGYFKCSCGYSGNVENGIYISLDEEDRKKIRTQSPRDKVEVANTLGEYVDGTNPSLINHIYKSIDAIVNFMEVENLDNKIILELGTGSGFFIRQFLAYIKPGNIYIVTDHNLSRMKDMKLYLEEHSRVGKFVFICADLDKLPIKNKAADYVINYLTSMSYNLNSSRFLDSIIIPKIKKDGRLIGSSYYVKSGSKLLLSLPMTSRKFYEETGYKKEIMGLDLNTIEVKEVGSLDIESKYELMIKGMEVYTLAYCGKR